MSKKLKDELFGSSEASGIKEWVKNIVEQVKKEFGIGTGKSLMQEEVGKVLSAEIGDGLVKNSKQAVSAFKAVKTELDYQRKLDLIDEETYYSNLETIRDRYFREGSENWVKYTAEIYDYQKNLLEQETKNLTDIYDTVSEYAGQKLEEIIKKQERFAKKLSDVGGIYKRNTVYMNGKVDTYYSTRDLRSDIDDIRAYANALTKMRGILESSGMEKSQINGFLEEINAMGTTQGLSYMNNMFLGGEENIKSYAKLWAEKNAIAIAVSKEAYKSEFETLTDDVADTIKTALENAGYQIPQGFFDSGKLSAENFGKAFLSELDSQLEEIRGRIMQFTDGLSVNAGNTYNTTNQYNISSESAVDTVEQIKRYDTVKRLSGI